MTSEQIGFDRIQEEIKQTKIHLRFVSTITILGLNSVEGMVVPLGVYFIAAYTLEMCALCHYPPHDSMQTPLMRCIQHSVRVCTQGR